MVRRSWNLEAVLSSLCSARGWPGVSVGSMPRVRSRTPWRMRRTSGLLVWTTMPSVTGVWQEAGKPRRPSTCTRHVRHAPMAGMAGSLHSWGM